MSTTFATATPLKGLDASERALYKSALKTPSQPEGWARLAQHLSGRGEHRKAVACLWEGVASCGNLPHLLGAIADLLIDAPGHPDRIEALARLAVEKPDDVPTLVNLGMAALHAPNASYALPSLRRAVELGENRLAVLLPLALVERQFGSIEASLALFARAVAIEPDHKAALVEYWYTCLNAFDWVRAAQLQPAVEMAFDTQDAKYISPQVGLALPLNKPHRLRDLVERNAPSRLSGRGFRHAGEAVTGRLRVGYLSSDFFDHATLLLTRGLFAAHDRDRFEVFVYSYGPSGVAQGTPLISDSVEHWYDIAEASDDAAASLIRSHKLDVLVEMKGHTAASRGGISRQRVAPVQIHYLGCPGPVGGFGIDCFVADDVTVPPGAEDQFNVPVVRLPRPYQVNDDQRPIPHPVSRASPGAADDSIVLANFNQLWKISPEFMGIWARALRAHPKAVLWLLEPTANDRNLVMTNLHEWLNTHGLGDVARRISFQPRLKNDAHMNRLAACDLALDQLPCGSHTTASDALWAGVPLLTVTGDSFAGRVATALLSYHGEAAFITNTIADYERRLGELLDNPDELANARRRLLEKRTTSPLFDTAGFTRDWESLLFAVHKDYGSGRLVTT